MKHLTDKELNAPIQAITVKVWGKYLFRGDTRKEVLEDDFEADVEVPVKYHAGHVKLAANRYVKRELKGIRAKTYNVDREAKPVPVKDPRKVRDFMSDMALNENQRLKDIEENERRKKEQIRQEYVGGVNVDTFSNFAPNQSKTLLADDVGGE